MNFFTCVLFAFVQVIKLFFELCLLVITKSCNCKVRTSSGQPEVIQPQGFQAGYMQLDDQEFIDKFRPYLPSDARLISKADLFHLIGSNSRDPFVLQMVKVRNTFDSQWPPRASFDNWPKEWDPYMEMAEEMSFKMRDLDSPASYRAWILSKCSEINLSETKRKLEEKWQASFHSPEVYGLMGTLAKLIYTFRWGKLPVIQEEVDRKTLAFPAELMDIFEMISHHYGTLTRGSIFSTAFGSAMYVPDEGKSDLLGPRFYFTAEEDKRRMERSFFNSFVYIDQKVGETLPTMSQYMALTNFALEAGPEVAKLLLDQRVKCLSQILHNVKEMSKTFRNNVNERKVQPKYWGPYIQAVLAWNINGELEGMSGAESLTFNLLDTFLGIKGWGTMYRASIKKLQTLPAVCRDLILTLSKDDNTEERFLSYLDLADDPILKVKDEIVCALYCWRLGHAKLPLKYFRKDCMTTSGGVVETNLGDESLSLAEQAEKLLRLRAIETKACIRQTTKPGRRASAPVF